jgi:hypothetical protein
VKAAPQDIQEGEDGVPPSGASDGEYRGLAVSQAEAVLEPPPPPPVIPQQHAGGLDLHPSLQPQVHAQPGACRSGRDYMQDSMLAAISWVPGH